MATPKSLASLKKCKESVLKLKEKIKPVLQRLAEDDFGEETGRAKASVALSIAMMRYMGARLRGLDHGRKPDDPLRKDLNNIKRVIAKTKRKTYSETETTKSKHVPTEDSHVSGSSNVQKVGADTFQEKKMRPKAQSSEDENEKKRKVKAIVINRVNRPESASKKSRKR